MTVYFDELTVGQQFESVGRTVTEHDVMAFAGISGDFNPLHTDLEFARKGPFGERIAHGVLVLAISTGLTQRLGIFDGSALALLSLEWKFLAPVRLNDTVHFVMTIESLRESSSGDRGVVVRRFQMLNQRNEVVQEGSSKMLVAKRPPS